MNEHFATLTEAITYVFQKEKATILSLDQICQGLSQPNLFLQTSQGLTLCTSISRKRVSSILSSSEIFTRAGPPRSCMWSLKPSNPLCLSDGAILTCINQILTENGPLTIESIIEQGDLSEATPQMIEDFLNSHDTKYQIQPDNSWWFANQPLPRKWKFDSVVSALTKSFEILQHEASIEELNWLLCLSTLPQGKRISRRKISRELSRRPDLFQHISRAKYSLISTEKSSADLLTISNSNSGFNNFNILSSNLLLNQSSNSSSPQPVAFHINYNKNHQLPQNPSMPVPRIQSSMPLQPSIQPQSQQINQWQSDLPFDEIKSVSFDTAFEPSKVIEFPADWSSLVPKCETPPVPADYFDPEEFFSVGFSGTFE